MFPAVICRRWDQAYAPANFHAVTTSNKTGNEGRLRNIAFYTLILNMVAVEFTGAEKAPNFYNNQPDSLPDRENTYK